VKRQIGVRDFKYVGKFCPPRTGHVIRRMRIVAANALSMLSYGSSQNS